MYWPYWDGPQQQAQPATPLPAPFPAPSWYPPPSQSSTTSTSHPPYVPGMGVPPPVTSLATGLDTTVIESSESRLSPSVSTSLQHELRTRSSEASFAVTDMSMEELQRLLSSKDAYNKFLHSFDSVRHVDSLWSELLRSNIQLARQNLDKESRIAELKNQCSIIRTTEVAAARERFDEVQKRVKEINAVYAPPVLLKGLQEAASRVDEESENLHSKLLSGEIDLGKFIQEYRKKRLLYHRWTLLRLAAMASVGAPG